MKLTERQKKILLFSSLFFFLAITVLAATFLLTNKKSTPSDSPSLTNVKTEAITEIERKLSADNIKKENLLQQLKSDHNLTAGENNWEEYLKGATTASELEIRKKKILDIVAKLTKIPTTPQSPTPTPENKWEKILREIREFVGTNPQTLEGMKTFANKYPDPLTEAKVKLEGVGMDELRKISGGRKIVELETETKPEIKKFENYVALPTSGGGNCFLYAWSIYLTGRSDTEVMFALRVAICLELMKNPERYDKDIGDVIAKMKKENWALPTNRLWLSNDDIEYLANILKRPLTVLIRIPNKDRANWGANFGVEEYYQGHGKLFSSLSFNPTYKETWYIWNSGGHFEALIPSK